jgi:hypothetical protein
MMVSFFLREKISESQRRPKPSFSAGERRSACIMVLGDQFTQHTTHTEEMTDDRLYACGNEN